MIQSFAVAGSAALLAFALEAAPVPSAEKAINGWPERAKLAARATIEAYGQPDEAGADALVWRNNGPWKRTVVYRRAWPRAQSGEDKNYLENTVAYRLRASRAEDAVRFDSKVDADPKFKELSSRSESEAMNFLTLNLAHEVVVGRRSPEDARRFGARIARLAASGKSSPYLEKLLFRTMTDINGGIDE